MSGSARSQLISLVLIAFFVGLGVLRRMRPQPVRTGRIVVTGVIIVVLIGLGLVGTGGRIIADPLAVILVPVFLALGVGIGYYLVRTMTFWTDPNTGALWMRGGALFALILVGTILVRLGVRTALLGSPFAQGAPGGGGQNGLLYDLSADLLFLSLGLWAARAYFLVQRQRAHEAARPA